LWKSQKPLWYGTFHVHAICAHFALWNMLGTASIGVLCPFHYQCNIFLAWPINFTQLLTRTLKTISLRDTWSTGHCAHLEILVLIHHKHLENHYEKKHVNVGHCAHFIGHLRILDCPNFSLAPNQAQGPIPNKFHKK
jgi:hypothetical protein